MAMITRHPRQRVEVGRDFEWDPDNWTHNAFRAYEFYFGRRYGKNGIGDTIRAECSAISTIDEDGVQTVMYFFHTTEAVLAHIEGKVRAFLKGALTFPVRIYIPQLAMPGGMQMPMGMSPYLFAVAYDNAGAQMTNSGQTNTLSFTVSGSNTFLYHFGFSENSSITGVTYNGAAMTDVGVSVSLCKSFYKINPATGAHNAVSTQAASVGGTHYLGLVSYSGASQTAPDATATSTPGSGTSISISVVTTVANCMVTAGFLMDTNTSPTAGANTTVRSSAGGNTSGGNADSGSAVAAIGSFTLTVTHASTAHRAIGISIAPAVSAPTVTTQAVSSIGKTTATGNGNVTSDGGDTITERGTVYSTSANPTTSDTKDTSAGTTGAFTTSIDSLTMGTLYHVRAYAINSAGTSYGSDVTFTTVNEVAITKSLKYTVKATPAAVTKSLKYVVRTTFAGITKAMKYTVTITPATLTKSLQYAVRVATTPTQSLEYQVKAPVSVQLSAKYTVIATPAAVTKSAKYTVTTTPATLEESLAYYVRKAITITKGVIYTIKAPVTVQKGLVYDVLSTSAPTKALKYTVKTTPATVTKDLGYYVMIPATLQLGLQYAVRGPISSTKALKYTVVVFGQSLTESLAYAVKKANTISLGLAYNLGGIIIQKSLKYTVRTTQVLTKSLEYMVQASQSAIQKSAKYTVKTSSTKTKSLEYRITGASVAMQVQYKVRKARAVTRSLKYVVTAPGTPITKTLTYAVRVYPYRPKPSPYSPF